MSEEKNVMQDALVSIIQKTQQGIDASVSFLSEQIPDVVQQLLIWKASEALLWAVIQLSFGIAGLILLVRGARTVSHQIKLWGAEATARLVWHESPGREGKTEYKAAEIAAEHHIPNMVFSILLGCVGVIFLFAFLLNFFGNIMTAVQIYIAPKVYLIEYATRLVK